MMPNTFEIKVSLPQADMMVKALRLNKEGFVITYENRDEYTNEKLAKWIVYACCVAEGPDVNIILSDCQIKMIIKALSQDDTNQHFIIVKTCKTTTCVDMVELLQHVLDSNDWESVHSLVDLFLS